MWEQTKCPSMDGWMDKRRSIHSTWASQVGPVVKNPPADTEDVGEAAFYGPKVDINARNVYGKEDTMITIQLDTFLAEEELPRQEIVLQPSDHSLTNEMMKRFRDGQEAGRG